MTWTSKDSKRLKRRLAASQAFHDKEKFDSKFYTVMKSGARCMRPRLNVIEIRRGIRCDPLIVNRIARNLYVWQKRNRRGSMPYNIFLRNVQLLSSWRGGYMVEFDFYDMSMRFEYTGVVDNDCWLMDHQDVGNLLGEPTLGWSVRRHPNPESEYALTGSVLTYTIRHREKATANRSFV